MAAAMSLIGAAGTGRRRSPAVAVDAVESACRAGLNVIAVAVTVGEVLEARILGPFRMPQDVGQNQNFSLLHMMYTQPSAVA